MSLAAAYDLIKGYPETAPPLLLRPVMTATEGLVFHLVLEESFANETAARAQIGRLPGEWQAKVQLRHGSELW